MQQERIDVHYLASTRVGAPDPRLADPPLGERILIGWDFPKSLFEEQLTLLVTVRLWDNQETVYKIPVERKRDATDLYFPSSNKILTYRIQVINKEGQVIETWKHQFWAELIHVDDTISSVSSHPKQGSVIETP